MKILNIFLLIFAISCTKKNNTELQVENKIKVSVYESKISKEDSTYYQKNPIFRLHYAVLNEKSGYYVRTLNLDTYFIEDSLNDIQRRSMPLVLNPKSDLFYHNGKIFAYNTQTKYLKEFNSKENTDSIKMNTIRSEEKFSPLSRYDQKLLKINDTFAFIYNYGLTKSKHINYIDSSPFVIFRPNQYTKIGRYPNEFHKKRIRNANTHFVIGDSNFIYYIHESFDSVYKMNTSGDIINQNVLHQYPKREYYNTKKSGDLAFVRYFESVNEFNVWIHRLANNNIIVLKKLAKSAVLEPDSYKFFIFNTNLDRIYADTIKQKVLPAIINTKNGFQLFSSDYTKFIKYEY